MSERRTTRGEQERRRANLAEELLKIGAERWSQSDSLVAMAMSCKEAAGVIYPELEPEECRHGTAIGDDCGLCELQGPDRPVPPPTREGMLSVTGVSEREPDWDELAHQQRYPSDFAGEKR